MTGGPRAVAVVSPHLDDAVFSCFEHIREFRRGGADVTVINCFSRCRNDGIVSPVLAPYLRAANCHGPEEYEKIRKTEDAKALDILGIDNQCLDFIDAAFRGSQGKPAYETLCSFYKGPSDKAEMDLAEALAGIFDTLAEFDMALVPMAIGNHIDHVLSRLAAERCKRFKRLAYYADMPYAVRPWKWRALDIKRVFSSSISLRFASALKRQAISCYGSQLEFSMPCAGRFPELLLHPRAAGGGL